MPVHIIIDIILIAFIVLGALIGMWRGFFKTIISLIGWTVSLLVAIVFARMVADTLLQVPFFSRIILGDGGPSLARWIEGGLPSELGTIYAADAYANSNAINNAMDNSFLSFLLTPLFYMVVDPAAEASSLTVAEIFSLAIANHLFVALVGFVIMMIVRIFVAFVTMAVDSFLQKREKLKSLDRAGGFFAGILKHCLYVFIIFIGLSFVIATPFMTPARNQIERTNITSHVANGTVRIADRYLTGDEGLIARLIDLSGRDENTTGDNNYDENTNEEPNNQENQS